MDSLDGQQRLTGGRFIYVQATFTLIEDMACFTYTFMGTTELYRALCACLTRGPLCGNSISRHGALYLSCHFRSILFRMDWTGRRGWIPPFDICISHWCFWESLGKRGKQDRDGWCGMNWFMIVVAWTIIGICGIVGSLYTFSSNTLDLASRLLIIHYSCD